MENEEKVLNPAESLRIIRETIDVANKGVQENGFHFLLWGWLVVIAGLAEYYLRHMHRDIEPSMVWMIMPVIGVPAAFIYEWRRDKKQQSQNIVREWYGMLWLGFGISLILAIALTVRAHVSPIPVILILAAFATFMSGILLRFKALVFGAIVLWAGAAICMAVPIGEHALVQAGATVLGYLVPGYMLNQKARSRHV